MGGGGGEVRAWEGDEKLGGGFEGGGGEGRLGAGGGRNAVRHAGLNSPHRSLLPSPY